MADEGKIPFDTLNKMLLDATNAVQLQLKKMETTEGTDTDIAVTDMFKMQLLMNHMSQLAEMNTAIMSAQHSALSSMVRNVKA